MLTVENRSAPVFVISGNELWELGGLGSGSMLAQVDGTSTGWQEEEKEDGGEVPEA